MGITSLMEIGKSGLGVYQSAIEITSENIANVNTPGYSRQGVLLKTAPMQASSGQVVGTGVQVAAIQRYYDILLQRQQITGQTTQGFDTTKSQVLQQIEPAFNEVANDGIGAAITDYFNAWQDLTLNPAGTAERQTVMTRGQLLADTFHTVSKTLNDAVDVQDASLVPLADTLNATLKDIAQLNVQIQTINASQGNPNEVMDRRDQLIRDLSAKIGITYTENTDGTTDIRFADSGASIVTGSLAGTFSLTVNGGTGRYDVNITDTAGAGPAVVAPATGELGAIVALRDTILPGYLDKVDQLASAIIDNVNTLHAAGFSPTGGSGQNFFTPLGAVAGAAADISLDAGLTTTTIAAAQAAGLPGENRNALAIAQLIYSKDPDLDATYNSYFDSISSEIGLNVLASKNTVAQDEAFNRQLAALRNSNSGVSLDEELTNLVKYQRSYQASAKLITTATEMMDMVLGLVG